MFQACEQLRNSWNFSYLRLASNVGIRSSVKLSKCVSQYFKGIVSIVRNNFNWSTIHIQMFKPFQRQINELNSIGTVRASFDASMKYPINLVEDRFKHLNMDGRPVKVISYNGYNTFKVLTDALA